MAAFLVVFSIYRPFITKLDTAKYIIFGCLSFLLPFFVEHRYTSLDFHTPTFSSKQYTNYTASLYPVAAVYNLQTSSHYNNNNNPIYNHNSDTNATESTFRINQCLIIDAAVSVLISLITVSICGLSTRWHFPITFIKPTSTIYTSNVLKHGVSIALIFSAISSQSLSSRIVPFSLAFIGLLWFFSGPYFVQRWRAIAVSTIIPTAFEIIVGCIAQTNSTLHKLSLFEWFLITLGFVLTSNLIDFLDAILNMYPHLVETDKSEQAHIQCATTFSYWYALMRLFLICISSPDSIATAGFLHPAPIEDFETAIRALGPASRSWKTMAALFPTNLRQDLCLLYAFFRTADDLVDDAPTPRQCEKNLITIRRFLRDVFFPPATTTATTTTTTTASATAVKSKLAVVTDPTLPSHIDWAYYANLLPNDDVLAIFRNFARISHYLCPRAMSELTDAWEHDLRGEPVKKQKDLLNYAALISGTFGELCTCVIMYKTGRGNWGPSKNNPSRIEETLLRARATGQCLQLINIARDIIADSLVGRCYVPLQYMPYPPQTIYHLLKVARTPYQVGEQTLKSFSLRIIQLADQIADKAQKGIDGLPEEVQDSIRAAFEIYMAIGPTLKDEPGFPLRTKVPKRQQQWIALRCIYGFRGPVARAISVTFYKMVSFYTTSFARFTSSSNTRATATTRIVRKVMDVN
ncbi:Squalene/phytoene synthase-domain-containing protein [Mycotypha africana]|uniref:Squalene/phytoene synthase-domain-containing protein n=1 Tax=Mycotypha africana TaxID=64632 RepID=UPI0023016A68|nr:Squalene/phytoene synthase-domain-containing protein [Mycotypha africana]KAI8973627.1 Squalene/phytoene synthase-domain-containing protein [Mycotypha africana]